MTTALYFHPVCTEHDPGAGHPECPDRLRAVMAALEASKFDGLDRREAPVSGTGAISRVHDEAYIQHIFHSAPSEGRVFLDPDTAMSPASQEAALRAAGGICAGVDAVMSGVVHNGFCAVRPPGHHAERGRAMGFCLFNNVAIAACHARQVHGLARVAVVDFDVHHGNGTQHSFYDDDGLFFGSSHQWPAYPGTGRKEETGGEGRAGGTNCNVPLQPGAGSLEFRDAWSAVILPALADFNPDFVIISAGFDAHQRDPLADLNVQTGDYGWVTEQIMQVAGDCCDGRLVSSLEGGYDLQALGESTVAHVRALMNH